MVDKLLVCGNSHSGCLQKQYLRCHDGIVSKAVDVHSRDLHRHQGCLECERPFRQQEITPGLLPASQNERRYPLRYFLPRPSFRHWAPTIRSTRWMVFFFKKIFLFFFFSTGKIYFSLSCPVPPPSFCQLISRRQRTSSRNTVTTWWTCASLFLHVAAAESKGR